MLILGSEQCHFTIYWGTSVVLSSMPLSGAVGLTYTPRLVVGLMSMLTL